MKKNYEKPLAKKVTFNYQKVLASSTCHHQYVTHEIQGCVGKVKGNNVLALDDNGCAWISGHDE